jgi:hypothetical protein
MCICHILSIASVYREDESGAADVTADENPALA